MNKPRKPAKKRKSPEERYQDLAEQAMRAFQAGNNTEALKAMEKAFKVKKEM